MSFKKSFKSLFGGNENLLDRISGSVPAHTENHGPTKKLDVLERQESPELARETEGEEIEEIGELAVDVFETDKDIVVKAFIAGVAPEDIDVEITREMVTIRGERKEDRKHEDKDHFHQELYWGAFSRTIVLPQEVIVDESEARHKDGMLTITMPKIDRKRIQKLKVKED